MHDYRFQRKILPGQMRSKLLFYILLLPVQKKFKGTEGLMPASAVGWLRRSEDGLGPWEAAVTEGPSPTAAMEG